jgi:3-carboxy-cis,cis-muconate cycloisomerase
MFAPAVLHALVGDAEIEALFTDTADLAAMLRIESALAEAEAAAGLVSDEAARRIGAVCGAFSPDHAALAAGLARDGVMIPALVTQLRAAVGAPHAAAVHFGATSQDIIDTSLVLRLQSALAILDDRIARLLDRLAALRVQEGDHTLMAHTRMQAALPFHVADKLDTWSGPLRRHRARLGEIRPRLLLIQFGGPVGTRAQLSGQGDAVAAGLARRLGLGDASPWPSQRDSIGELGAWLSLVSGALGKIGQDIALMAQNEIGAVRLAKGGASSAMPHKQNPVPAEVLVALARFNAGMVGTLHQALVHENERSGAAWTLEWLVLPQMLVAAAAGLRLADGLLRALSFTS